MSTEIKVPPLPESVSEATVVTWHKQPGDPVKREENIVDIETDKVVLEVPAPEDGVMGEILKGEGDTVVAGDVLAILQAGAAAAAKPAAAAPVETNTEDLSPAVRRLLTEHNLDPAKIQGKGKGGRITKEDVLDFLAAAEGSEGQPVHPAPQAAAPAKPAAPAKAPAPELPVLQGERVERRVPMTRLRARIAERLVEAQHTAALLTTFNEVNMAPVMELRAKYKDRFEKAHGIKLGFMGFFVKAAVEALKRYPAVNASIDGNDIVYHGYFDIGVAVSSPRGLVVPVLRDADQLSLAQIEAGIAELGTKARDGKLSMEELTGGTFSITNGGIFGSLLSTPILNPPQSGILGMHAIKDRAVVEDGQVVARPMMYLALTYDHRIIDGREAVSFLVTLKDMIEDPSRLLLEI